MLADGLLGSLLVFSVASTAGRSSFVAGGEDLGLVATAASGMPLAMLSVAAALSRTDPELLASVPLAAVMHFMLMARSAWYSESRRALALPAGALVLHLALYLPLPPGDHLSNPFHSDLQKRWRKLCKLMSQPIAGWGDSAEDGVDDDF